MKIWVLLILLLSVKLFDNEYMNICVMGVHFYTWMALYHCGVEFAQSI